jgi:hypothetical protein
VDEEYAKNSGMKNVSVNWPDSFPCWQYSSVAWGCLEWLHLWLNKEFRKSEFVEVLGASVLNLWGLLSKDFLGLVMLSLIIAVPLSFYFMGNWLASYTYHSDLSWWILYLPVGALLINIA